MSPFQGALQPSSFQKIPLPTWIKINEDIHRQLFTVFQIPLDILITSKFHFMEQLRMPTTVVDTWPYYEFEEYVKLLNKKNEEEEKQSKDQESKQNSQSSSGFNPGKMVPNIPKFNMPNIPKFR